MATGINVGIWDNLMCSHAYMHITKIIKNLKFKKEVGIDYIYKK